MLSLNILNNCVIVAEGTSLLQLIEYLVLFSIRSVVIKVKILTLVR